MARENDQEFVEYVVKEIVSKPDKIKVERKIDEKGVLLELYVDSEDMGVIIGKEGRTAKAIRTLLRVIGAKEDARVNLKIIEPEDGNRKEKSKEEPKEEEKKEDQEEPMADLDL